MSITLNEITREAFEYSRQIITNETQAFYIKLGPKSVKVSLPKGRYIYDLISSAFIRLRDVQESDYELVILEIPNWEKFQMRVFSIKEFVADTPLDNLRDFPIKAMFNFDQNMVYFYNSEKKQGVICLNKLHLLDVRSFITPFRLMFSWMAMHFGGEIVHGAVIGNPTCGVLINGPKGAGKSTLSLNSLRNGLAILSDDAVLIVGETAYAIYSRAKVEDSNVLTREFLSKSISVKSENNPKRILPLEQFGNRFMTTSKLRIIIIPSVNKEISHREMSYLQAARIFLPNSMREIFGGSKLNYLRQAQILKRIPIYALEASTNMDQNVARIKILMENI
jgi:hypothetical protein